MSSPAAQLSVEVLSSSETPSKTNSHRWIDLVLVMGVAFGSPLLSSFYLAFHPEPLKYSNIRVVGGILAEATAMLLFFVLFSRQRRRFADIGFGFRWTDLPKGLALILAAGGVMGLAYVCINYAWFFMSLRSPYWSSSRMMFAGVSIWLLLPFLLLNPFFEEILVRGYLTTELIDLKGSVWLATLISLAVQTCYHLYYGVAGALLVGCGLGVFAIYYAKSRRLMPVIAAHMIWDLTALLATWHR